MHLIVNGEPFELGEGTTLVDLLRALRGEGPVGPVAIERNGEVVPRRLHGTTELGEGDRIEIVHFVGGGR